MMVFFKKKSIVKYNNSMLHKKLLKQMSLIKLQIEYSLKEDQLVQKLKQWLEIYYFLSIIDFVYLLW
jgi:hypothetical protein